MYGGNLLPIISGLKKTASLPQQKLSREKIDLTIYNQLGRGHNRMTEN